MAHYQAGPDPKPRRPTGGRKRKPNDLRHPALENPFEEDDQLITGDLLMDGSVVEVKVGPQGRVVIPAPLREQLEIAEGTVLVARTEGRYLVLEARDAIRDRLRAEFAGFGNTSMADELLEERRREAKREERRPPSSPKERS